MSLALSSETRTALRNIALLRTALPEERLKAAADNPKWIEDSVAHCEKIGSKGRSCDVCSNMSMPCFFVEDGAEVTESSCDLCAPCLVALQAGRPRFANVVEALDAPIYACQLQQLRGQQPQKFEAASFCPNNGCALVECQNCKQQTRSVFVEGDRSVCPICFVVVQHGALFVGDIDAVCYEAVTTLLGPDKSYQNQIFAAFMYTWNGEGTLASALDAWCDGVHQ